MLGHSIVSCLILTVAVMMCSCRLTPSDDANSTSDSELILVDQAGEEIVRGTLSWPAEIPASGEFIGRWTLRSTDDGLPVNGSGAYTGAASEGVLSLNLNPDMADNNVELRGTIANGRFSGSWYHVTFAGPILRGTFSVAVR